MKKTIFLRMLASLCVFFLAAHLGILAQSPAPDATLTGLVSCKHCRAVHYHKGATQSACTVTCTRDGSDYVLVVGRKTYGDRIYKLEGDKALFETLAGRKATLTGRLISNDEFQVTGGAVAQK
jgi:hypothetical protein